MLGLDVIGISWGDVADAGKAAFPYVHATGKGIASAFGAGAAADALESVEQKQGWLPAAPSSTTATVTTTAAKVSAAAAPRAAAAAASGSRLRPGVSPMTQPPTSSPTAPAAQTQEAYLQRKHTNMILGGVGVGVFVVLTIVLGRAYLHAWD